MQSLKIVLLAVTACVLYGVVHDQFTARICVEYFTVGHPPVFGTDDPTLLGLGWGVIATWWVGVLLGVPLALAARVGSRPKLAWRKLVQPLCVVMAVSAVLAIAAGAVGYFAASGGQLTLWPAMADRLPPEKHVPFLVDLCAHNASYAGGFLGGAVLTVWVWRRRGVLRSGNVS
ncbi:MAG: hypothetical protein AAGA92_06530 [Planctomycetota bacterium]